MSSLLYPLGTQDFPTVRELGMVYVHNCCLNKVVVLIDEYDNSLINTLHKSDTYPKWVKRSLKNTLP